MKQIIITLSILLLLTSCVERTDDGQIKYWEVEFTKCMVNTKTITECVACCTPIVKQHTSFTTRDCYNECTETHRPCHTD